MAERASLKRKNSIVNQRAAFGAILFLAACGGNEEVPVNQGPDSVSTPVVWQTERFDTGLTTLSVSPSGEAVFLVGLENEGLKFTNIDGTAISEAAPYRNGISSTGVTAQIDGTYLVLFPGVSRNSNQIVVVVHGDDLLAPIEVELDVDVTGSVEGVCASRSQGDGSIMNIGYWTSVDPTSLYTGSVGAEGTNFTFTPGDIESYEQDLTGCALTDRATIASGRFGIDIRSEGSDPVLIDMPGVPTSVSAISDGNDTNVAMAMSGGEVYVANSEGNFSRVEFAAGLSATGPENVRYLVMTQRADIPGFSSGFLAMDARGADRTSQIVIADYEDLFRQLSDS